MRVGVTATRAGITDHQKRQVETLFRQFYDIQGWMELHHGMCIGGDLQAHDIARNLFGSRVTIHGHAGVIERYRASCDCDVYYEPKWPPARNKDIVDAVQTMIALPGESEEVLRSGTWMTIRYARKVKRRMIIVYPEPSDDLAA